MFVKRQARYLPGGESAVGALAGVLCALQLVDRVQGTARLDQQGTQLTRLLLHMSKTKGGVRRGRGGE
jgi:hypothetical protein